MYSYMYLSEKSLKSDEKHSEMEMRKYNNITKYKKYRKVYKEVLLTFLYVRVTKQHAPDRNEQGIWFA